MKLKELIEIMCYNTRVRLYDTNGGFDCYLAYSGNMEFIPDNYNERKVKRVDSGTTYIDIILEYDD